MHDMKNIIEFMQITHKVNEPMQYVTNSARRKILRYQSSSEKYVATEKGYGVDIAPVATVTEAPGKQRHCAVT